MNTLQLLSFNDQNVRTVVDGDTPWFVVADVCRVMKMSNPSMAAKTLDEDDLSTTEVIDSMGRKQVARTTNESGIYQLAFQSRKPEAKAFKRWVTSEVLPAIRKTGSYSVAAPAPVDLSSLTPRMLAELILVESDRADAAVRQAEVAERHLALVAPKVELFDDFYDSDNEFDVREAAHLLANTHGINIGEKRLFRFLRERKWIGADNRVYQDKIDQDLMSMRFRDFVITRKDGSKRMPDPQPRVTAKGIIKLRKLLTEPLFEVKAIEASPETPDRRRRRSLNPGRV